MESMPLRDRLYMPPIERYEKYGKYPWRLIIDVLLLAFTTCQLLLVVTPNNLYARNQLKLWEKVFVPDPPIVYGISDLQELLKKTIIEFKAMNVNSFDDYQFVEGHPAKLHVYRLNRQVFVTQTEEYIHTIDDEDLGVLGTGAKMFLRDVVFFYLEFQVRHILPDGKCFHWTLEQNFHFEHWGPVSVSMKTIYEGCSSEILHIADRFAWLHLLVLILAISAFSITVRSFLTRIDIVAEIRGDNPQKVWSHLELQEKLSFFPLWLIVTAVGNVSQFFGSILGFVDVNIVHSTHAGLIGLGCFCSWVSIIRYFENNSELYTLANTVKRAGRVLLFFISGVAPVFLGYTFLGMSFLTDTGYFNDLPSSIATLYAVMCGDTIHAVFMSAMDVAGFFGGIYVLSFIIFFIACVHNIFIAIIQDSFYSLKTKPPRRGDESSEDEARPSKPEIATIARMESKKKSRQTFKRLITREEPLLSQDEEQRNTEDVVRRLGKLQEEVVMLIQSIEAVGHPSEKVDETAVEEKLKEVKAELEKALKA